MKSALRSNAWRALLFVTGLCFLALSALGCAFWESPPPKVIFDPGMVQKIHIQGNGIHPDVITDKAIIDKCVAEINALQYISAKRSCLITIDILSLRDSAGAPLFEMGIAPTYYIELRFPGDQRFRIREQPIPTIARLFSYEHLRYTVEDLRLYADKGKWNESDRTYVAVMVETGIKRFWPRQAFPAPDGPADLREALNRMPPVTLSRLEEYVPYTEAP